MTVYLITAIHRFIGESFDAKPTTGIPPGSTFFETDTKNSCVYTGSAWSFTTGSPVYAIRATHALRITEEEEEYETAYIVGTPSQRLSMVEALSIVSSLQERSAADAMKFSEATGHRFDDNIDRSVGIGLVEVGEVSVTE